MHAYIRAHASCSMTVGYQQLTCWLTDARLSLSDDFDRLFDRVPCKGCEHAWLADSRGSNLVPDGLMRPNERVLFQFVYHLRSMTKDLSVRRNNLLSTGNNRYRFRESAHGEMS